MRYEIPKDIKGKELFEYLKKHNKSIIKAKKSVPIIADKISVNPTLDIDKSIAVSKSFVEKAGNMPEYGNPFEKSVIGNLCGWCDSYDDVSLKGSFNRTVKNNGSSMYFLADHEANIKSQIAKNVGVTTQMINLADIGLTSTLSQQEAIVMRGRFDVNLDAKAYYLYYNDMIKEHSIKLKYIDVSLALNDPDDEEYYKTWTDYIGQVINRDKVDEQGFFYAVKEQKVFEFSGVLWGANSQTPVIDENKTTPIPEPATIGTSDKKDSVRKLFILQ